MCLFARAAELNFSYTTVTRWLASAKTECAAYFMPTGFPVSLTRRKIIVSLVFYKTCVRSVSNCGLARVMQNIHYVSLHHETVKSLLERCFFWRRDKFNRLVSNPIPADLVEKRLEIVKLYRQVCLLLLSFVY